MTDILLINPPIKLSQWELRLGSKLPPMGLASLAAYLRNNGISVRILDACNLGIDIEEVMRIIEGDIPAYIGITASTSMISFAAKLADTIKARFPGVVTVIGGPHLSALPEETIERFKSFDVGVYGEGEKTLLDILKRKRLDSTIDGIVYREGGKVIKTAPREYIKDLDELPFPAYDLLPGFPGFYVPTPNNYLVLPVAPIISSRGCPYSCTFCTQSVFGRKLRSSSVGYIIKHLKYLREKYGVREICFYDDIFLLNKEKLYSFIDALEKNGLDMIWSCEGRVDQFDDKMLRDMKKAGCWQISFGIENGSQAILDYFDKRIKKSQIEQALRSVKRAGMVSRAYLIIGSPPENKETLRETRDLMLNVPLDEIHISYFTPLPGSKAYDEIFGAQRVDDFKKINQYLVSYIPPALTQEALTDFMNDLYKRFYLNPKTLFRYFLMLFNRYKTAKLLRSFVEFVRLTVIGEKEELLS